LVPLLLAWPVQFGLQTKLLAFHVAPALQLQTVELKLVPSELATAAQLRVQRLVVRFHLYPLLQLQ
jgi:hypothetical protein